MRQIIYQLSEDDLTFPSPHLALTEPNGLLAIAGDLSPQRLINAYRDGIFPWYSEGDAIMWWSPDPRAIISIDQLNINKTLKKVIKKQPYRITLNNAFEEVIGFCADAPFRSEATWIVDDMEAAYIQLHQLGYAHSIEVWDGNELVGGLYGIAINGFFSGESMFYSKSNASKLALVAIAQHLRSIGITIIDCQLTNPFLESMGCIEIKRSDFIDIKAVQLTTPVPEDFWLPKRLNLNM